MRNFYIIMVLLMIIWNTSKNYNSNNIRKSPFSSITKEMAGEVILIHTATIQNTADHTF